MKKKVTIVGGGACALALACELDTKKFEVDLYERNPALGRKFLVAGEGGLNLTHSEKYSNFIARYTPYFFFEEAFSHFSNDGFRTWLKDLGINTFVGSSGRVFPEKGIKPIQVLNVFLNQIKRNKVNVFTKHVFIDFLPEKRLVFKNGDDLKEVKSDLVIFCLGGASWPVTGSKGNWAPVFEQKGIKVNPFKASNCSFVINWPETLVSKIEGKALKNISLTCGAKKNPGEIVLTRTGVEGSGIYPLSSEIRKELEKNGVAEIVIDLKPDLTIEKIREKIISAPAEKNITEKIKKHLNLSAAHTYLLKHFLTKEEFTDEHILSQKIKKFKLMVTATGPLEDAISTVGGIDLNEIDGNYQLKKLNGYFVIGEMLDYDAPTGGYLLQSCFSMAVYLAHYLNRTDE